MTFGGGVLPIFDLEDGVESELILFVSIKEFLHLRLHRRIHFNQRRPGTFEAFAGKFLRRVGFHGVGIFTFSSGESSFPAAR
jgi:hypothetical protein